MTSQPLDNENYVAAAAPRPLGALEAAQGYLR